MTIETCNKIQAPIERCFDLARSVEVHLAGNIHFGESAVAEAGVITGLIGMGEHVTWRAKHFGVWHRLTSEITAIDRPIYFQDTMTKGIFRFMQHDHYFRTLAPNETEMPAVTEMRDIFVFRAPMLILGRLAETLFLRRHMSALLNERNAVIKQIAESEEWRSYVAP